MLPYSREMMIVDISLDCVVSQTTMGHSRQASRPLSLMFPYSGRVMIVLRRTLYGVVSDGHVFGLFVPLPPAVMIGFLQEANFVGSVCWAILFLSAMLFVFHSRYQSTLIPVPPSILPM